MSRRGPKPKNVCHCGAPRRKGGNHCVECHRAAQVTYRERKATKLANLIAENARLKAKLAALGVAA